MYMIANGGLLPCWLAAVELDKSLAETEAIAKEDRIPSFMWRNSVWMSNGGVRLWRRRQRKTGRVGVVTQVDVIDYLAMHPWELERVQLDVQWCDAVEAGVVAMVESESL